MMLLVDQSAKRIADMRERYPFIGGSLQTPLSRYALADGPFAIDNGAFSGKCGPDELEHVTERVMPARSRCLFLAIPDVVESAYRTLEVFDELHLRFSLWPLALVVQDGQESLPIPWDQIAAIFVGGSTQWKMSQHVAHIIRAAQILGKHTHVGRVNTPERWAHFTRLGVDTCDGTGVSRYDWMLDNIAASLQERPLLCAGE